MRQQRRHHHRRGAAVVEMALVLPILVAVVLGVVEFGRSMMVGQVVSNAARVGARLAVTEGTTNDDVELLVLDVLSDTLGIDSSQFDLSIIITPAPGNDTTGNELIDAQSFDLVQVRVEVPFNEVSYIRPRYMEGKGLVGRVSMRHE